MLKNSKAVRTMNLTAGSPATPAGRWSRVANVLATIALFHLPLWLASLYLDVNRPFLNLDGVVAVAVGFRSRFAGAVLVVLAWLVDIGVSQALNYHFHSPAEFFAAARFGGALDKGYFVSSFGVLLLAGFCAGLVALVRLQRRPASWKTFGVVMVAAMVLDAYNGSSVLSKRDVQRVSINLAGSPTGLLALSIGRKFDSQPVAVSRDKRNAELHEHVRAWAAAHPQGAVMIVLVESMGLPIRGELLAWLEGNIAPPGSNGHEVSRAPVEFRGPTTWGELRTLCGLDGSYDKLDGSRAGGCLPLQLKKFGWTSIGYHGFTGNMFDRRSWWPIVGIEQRYFAEQLRSTTGRQCGAAFRGICDQDVLVAAAARLGPRQLVYVLTLNTHLPMEPQPVPAPLQLLCSRAEAPAEACQLLAAFGSLLAEIHRLAEAHPETLFLVVGDHAPPFRERNARKVFAADAVPAWLLVPREPRPVATAIRSPLP